MSIYNCFVLLYSGLEYQHFVVAEGVVAGSDDLLAGVETFENLVVLRVLATYAYFAAHCLAASRSNDIYPLASCLLVERTAGHEYGRLGRAELKVQIVSLAAADIVRSLPLELEVSLELAVPHFRIYLSQRSVECASLTLEGSREPGNDPVDIVLIYLGFNFI